LTGNPLLARFSLMRGLCRFCTEEYELRSRSAGLISRISNNQAVWKKSDLISDSCHHWSDWVMIVLVVFNSTRTVWTPTVSEPYKKLDNDWKRRLSIDWLWLMKHYPEQIGHLPEEPCWFHDLWVPAPI
jgi:hypothetical protein